MPIDPTTKVLLGVIVILVFKFFLPGDLNRLRADVKQAFDLKLDRPDKPWSKGDLIMV